MTDARNIEIQHRAGGVAVRVVTDGSPEPPGLSERTGPACADEMVLRARLTQALERAGRRADRERVAVLAIECHSRKRDAATLDAERAARVSRELVRRLRTHAGPGDVVAQCAESRFGMLLCGVEDASSAEHVAGAVVHDLGLPIALGRERNHVVNTSIGIAISPLHGTQADELLARAERARSEADALGGDSYLLAR
jgi:Amt family ammonium transporter